MLMLGDGAWGAGSCPRLSLIPMGEADVKSEVCTTRASSGCATPKDNGTTSHFPLKTDLAVLGDKDDRGGPPVPSVALGSLKPLEEETSTRHGAGPVLLAVPPKDTGAPSPVGPASFSPSPSPSPWPPPPPRPHQHEGVEHPGDVVGVQAVGVVPRLPAASAVAPAGGSGARGSPAQGHRGEGVLQAGLVGCDASQSSWPPGGRSRELPMTQAPQGQGPSLPCPENCEARPLGSWRQGPEEAVWTGLQGLPKLP